MKKACFGYLSVLTLSTVLFAGCGRSSKDDSTVPSGGNYYGNAYSPYGGTGTGYGTGSGYLPGIGGTNSAASLGAMSLSPSDVDTLKSLLGSSNQMRLSDLLQLISSNPADLTTVGNSVNEATQILSKADDSQIYQIIAAIIEAFRKEMAAVRTNSSQSERRTHGQGILGGLMQGIRNLCGRHGGGGGFGGGSHH